MGGLKMQGPLYLNLMRLYFSTYFPMRKYCSYLPLHTDCKIERRLEQNRLLQVPLTHTTATITTVLQPYLVCAKPSVRNTVNHHTVVPWLLH